MDVINSPLLDVIFTGTASDECSPEAAECLCTVLRETRDIDESQDAIHALFPRIVSLAPQITKVAQEEDLDKLKALTKIFATAATSWVVGIARQPLQFRPLVEAVLECAARDTERDVIEHTFDFWYELKQYLVLERYMQGRLELMDIFSKLVDILLKHLEYPKPESGNETDLFDGDREQEEKFREFRHRMGDTLKDSCDVMGVTECLTKVLDAIQLWMPKYAGQVNGSDVPHWQELEAPLFAMRALGRMVDKEENIVLPQLMPLLVQIPSHEKLRFATIMVLGRYTEWTADHPDYLEPQFQYIVASFQTESREILRAAALSLKFFCSDCKHLLSEQVLQLQTFYDQILDKLPDLSREEITEGMANVVAVQPVADTYRLLKTFVDPLVQRLMDKANNATNEEKKLALAGESRTPQPRMTDLRVTDPICAQITSNSSPSLSSKLCRTWDLVRRIRQSSIGNRFSMSCRPCWTISSISHQSASGFAVVGATWSPRIARQWPLCCRRWPISWPSVSTRPGKAVSCG